MRWSTAYDPQRGGRRFPAWLALSFFSAASLAAFDVERKYSWPNYWAPPSTTPALVLAVTAISMVLSFVYFVASAILIARRESLYVANVPEMALVRQVLWQSASICFPFCFSSRPCSDSLFFRYDVFQLPHTSYRLSF